MKKYNKNGQLETLICNGCGKKLAVSQGIIREGASIHKTMCGIDFFPKKGRAGSSF